MKKIYTILLVFFMLPFILPAQVNVLQFKKSGTKKVIFDFKMVNNMIVIPVIINKSDTLNFILDTGLKTSLITNLPAKDSSMLKFAKKYTIKGLGIEGDLDVFLSYGNTVDIHEIVCNNFNFYIITDDKFELTGQLGINIHGLIGADIFENFIVRINYSNNKIVMYKPETFKYTKQDLKQESFDLEFYKSKPYVNLKFTNDSGKVVDVKLLVDTGSSDALWLFETQNKQIFVPENSRYRFLGKGLSGTIFGFHARTKSLIVGKHIIENVSTAFPDTSAVKNITELDITGRNGSIGSELLRRFDIIIDYKNKKLTLEKNSDFNDDFNFNMGGIEVQAISGIFPVFEISHVYPESPAYLAGLRKGDKIITINGNSTFNFSVIEINSLMRQKPGKKITVVFLRGGNQYKTNFKLRKDI